jgi:redox-sensing transcriptional repressor
LQPIQVRQDLQLTEIVGKPKVGYPVRDLVVVIDKCLGWSDIKQGILVGAGSLGVALLGYPRFESFGLNLVAAFDCDPAKIGMRIRMRRVLPMERLPETVRRLGIKIGIITAPAAAAQRIADLLVANGILAIWNFAPVTLKVPASIVVHNEDLYYSLAALSSKLTQVIAMQNVDFAAKRSRH